jgi:uncharacterized protein YbjT (DUF2867 family)
VVIGGTGLVGSKLVSKLRQNGHEVVAAAPNSGVNTITGEGLAQALAGARVVVDVANSPSFEDRAVLEFFETSGTELDDRSLTPGDNARLGRTRFEDWLSPFVATLGAPKHA